MEYLIAVLLGGLGVALVLAGVNGSGSSLLGSITGPGSGGAGGAGPNPLAGMKRGPLGAGAIPGEHPASRPTPHGAPTGPAGVGQKRPI